MNSPAEQDNVPLPHANYVLALLLLAYILSFIDRQVMALLVGPIRAEFDISDTGFSLLHGFAFGIFYIVLGLPIGWLTDRWNRSRIVTLGVFLWSIMTCLCGTAKSFTGLFITRIGVGVGEAALSPPAYSLLSDYFPKKRLGRALAIFSMGITLGGGLALIVGGYIYAWYAAMPHLFLPLVGTLKPWQATFFTVGAPGLLLTIVLLFTVKEPPRRGRLKRDSAGLSLREVVRYLAPRWPAYVAHMMGISFLSILGYGTMAWYPEFLQRTYGMSRADAGSLFGTIFVIAGTAGAFLSARFAEWLVKRGYEDAPMRIIMLAAIGLVIPATVGPLMPTSTGALLVSIVTVCLVYGYFGVAVSALQIVTPNELRGQVSALMLLVTNLMGLACGPTVIALITDYVFGNDAMLRYSLSAVSAVMAPLAALIIGWGLKHYRVLLAEAGLREDK